MLNRVANEIPQSQDDLKTLEDNFRSMRNDKNQERTTLEKSITDETQRLLQSLRELTQ